MLCTDHTIKEKKMSEQSTVLALLYTVIIKYEVDNKELVQLFQTLNSKYEMIQDMLRRSTAVAVECCDPFGLLVSLGSPGNYKHLL